MRRFTISVIEQLKDIYYGSGQLESYKELIMALYMQIFSYNYDDKLSKSIKFNNISDIVKTVWVPTGTYKKTNELVGIPQFSEKAKEEFYSLNLNEKTEYILHEVRNSIVHGSFDINDDGTIYIQHDNDFRMVFEFDCIVDICDIIYNQGFNKVTNLEDLYKMIIYIKNIDKYDLNYKSKKINDLTFNNLKYPILLFNMLPMNQQDIFDNDEYIELLTNIFSEKEEYINGRLKNSDNMSAKDLYKFRNCISHNQFFISNNDFILYDNKKQFVLDCTQIDEIFEKLNLSDKRFKSM